MVKKIITTKQLKIDQLKYKKVIKNEAKLDKPGNYILTLTSNMQSVELKNDRNTNTNNNTITF